MKPLLDIIANESEQIRERAERLAANVTCGGNDEFFRAHLPTRPDWQLLMGHIESTLRQMRADTLDEAAKAACSYCGADAEFWWPPDKYGFHSHRTHGARFGRACPAAPIHRLKEAK